MPVFIDYTSLLGHYSVTTRSYSVGAHIGARRCLECYRDNYSDNANSWFRGMRGDLGSEAVKADALRSMDWHQHSIMLKRIRSVHAP